MCGLPKSSASCHAPISRGAEDCLWLTVWHWGEQPTENQIVYKDILQHLVRSVHDKTRSFWEAHTWTLHYDNAPAHTALSIRQFLAEKNIATLQHPHIPPIWLAVTFSSSPRLNVLKETNSSDIGSIKMAATTELKEIPENAFQECIESWKRRMHKCSKVKGDYCKGI